MPKFSRTTRRVPVRSLQWDATLDPVTMPDAAPAVATDPPAAGAATAAPGEMPSVPVRLVARTGKPVAHWMWSNPTVHDFAGMIAPPKIPIDYCHDSGDVIGFADSIDASSGDLVLSGMLTPLASGDRADEIARKSAKGVPYQASIYMGDDAISIEEVGAGSEALVNGQTVSGPVTIFRVWSLRGVAICPQGTDPNTSVSFSEDPEAKGPEAEVTVYTAEEPTTTPPGETKMSRTGRDYLNQFGDVGGKWFAEGLDWDAAQRQFAALTVERAKKAEAEIAQLRETVAALRGGTPIGYSAPTDQKGAAPDPKLAFSLPDPLARFAAANAAARTAAAK